MALFKPGMQKVPGSGRQKGVANKFSLNVLGHLKERGLEPVQEILKLLPSVDNAKQLEAWLKLLSYCYPTLKSIDLQGDLGSTVTITPQNIAELCQLARQSALEPAQIVEGDV